MVAYAMHLLRTQVAPTCPHSSRRRAWQAIRLRRLAAAPRFLEDLQSRHDQLMADVSERRGPGRSPSTRSRAGRCRRRVAGNPVISAECKGGIINTRHPGQVSRLYKGLCETVGLLMASRRQVRQVAVVPFTEGTLRLAERGAALCACRHRDRACRQPGRGHGCAACVRPRVRSIVGQVADRRDNE